MNKNSRLEIRLTELERLAIQERAKNSNMNVSEYVKKCCLQKVIKSRLTEKEKVYFSELSKMIVHFRNIANFFTHNGKFLSKDCRELAQKIKEDRNKLL